MADDELSRLLPPWVARMQWPLTYEGKNMTHFRREELRNHIPNSRQQLVNWINDYFYDGGRKGDAYAENIAKILDFPLGVGHGSYEVTRATAEDRPEDAAISLAMALPPPPVKKIAKDVGKSIRDIFGKRRRSSPDPVIEIASESKAPAVPQKSGPTAASIRRPDTSLVVPTPKISLPDTSLVVPRPHIIRPDSRNLQEAKRTDSFKPVFAPYPPPLEDTEIKFTLPGHWKQRSSPWVAQYPPMTMRRRPFRLDYPKDPPTDARGRILFDMEGRPLTARYIVGRNELNKSDRALTSGEMLDIIQNDLGLSLVSKPKSYFEPNTIGHLSIDPVDGRLAEIAVWNELPADQEGVTIDHELGHVFAEIAKQLALREFNDLREFTDELIPLYSAHSTGRIGPPYLLPENRGYAPHKAPHERAAEAFRIYSTGPNTMKSMAPKTAAAIRTLNDHPFFSSVVQFNGIPFGVTAGATATAAALGLAGQNDKASAASVHETSEANNADTHRLPGFARATSRGDVHLQPRTEEKFGDLVRTLTGLKARPNPQFNSDLK
ncbi:MAG: hypothetical protein ACOZAM_32860 [Pseudomonadota bacterium]